MRVLWFTNTPSLFESSQRGYNGGGWISALESEFSKNDKYDLGVGFFHNSKSFKIRRGNTIYYPISFYSTFIQKIRHFFLYEKCDNQEVRYYLKIIDDFKPDLIHVFGSELSFGLVSKYSNVPVVIHIQGILNPFLNAIFPPNYSIYNEWIYGIKSPLRFLRFLTGYRYFKHNAKREITIIENCKFFMGRTEWDMSVVKLLSPKSKYFLCNEMLRDDFYLASLGNKGVNSSFSIVTTISPSTYKGYDVILKTIKIIKKFSPEFSFTWNIVGITQYKNFDREFGLEHSDSIKFLGRLDAQELLDLLELSDLYVHPTYIDNSPNSICEAQMLSLPVIATNVGGVSSLIDNGSTGILVPANDPYMLASKIVSLSLNSSELVRIGLNGYEAARRRHDKSRILEQIEKSYNHILNG